MKRGKRINHLMIFLLFMLVWVGLVFYLGFSNGVLSGNIVSGGTYGIVSPTTDNPVVMDYSHFVQLFDVFLTVKQDSRCASYDVSVSDWKTSEDESWINENSCVSKGFIWENDGCLINLFKATDVKASSKKGYFALNIYNQDASCLLNNCKFFDYSESNTPLRSFSVTLDCLDSGKNVIWTETQNDAITLQDNNIENQKIDGGNGYSLVGYTSKTTKVDTTKCVKRTNYKIVSGGTLSQKLSLACEPGKAMLTSKIDYSSCKKGETQSKYNLYYTNTNGRLSKNKIPFAVQAQCEYMANPELLLWSSYPLNSATYSCCEIKN